MNGRATAFCHDSLAGIGRYSAGLILVGSIVLLSPAFGDQFDFGYGTPSAGKSASDEPWREAEVALPPFPADRDLVRVPPQPTDTFKIFVDEKSLSVGSDGVMRMTFVIESPSGVRNVLYDGIRCQTVEYKTYAMGTTERVWQPLRNARWQVIGPIGPNNYRRYLYQTLVCRKMPRPTPDQFIRDLKGIQYKGFEP